MRAAAFAIPLLLPLALVPRFMFYYDVTPKAVIVQIGAAVLLMLAALQWDSLSAFLGTLYGRRFSGAMAAAALLIVVSAAASPDTGLSWYGSNWRRFGAIAQLATLIAAWGIAACVGSASPGAAPVGGSRERLLPILRATCIAGTIAAVYGVLQYFGWDPFLPKSSYEAGEGPFQIVRPPGTLGHSDYFAAFLLWSVFMGAALIAAERRTVWKSLGFAAAVIGAIGIVLSGSRGALLGLVAGIAVLIWLRRPRLRTVAAGFAGFAAATAILYVSPAGTRLRARVHWIGDDVTGGARPLLWRDTLQMASARPWIGFGPETFVAEFPHYESPNLARAYPAFYHESPHNILLDSLVTQGIAGPLLLATMLWIGIAAGLRAPPTERPVAIGLIAGLVAATVAQQFVVFVIPTAFAFYLGIGLLAALRSAEAPVRRFAWKWPVAAAAGLVAIGLFAHAYSLTASDVALARVQRLLDTGDAHRAAELWRSAQNSTLVTADAYFSRRWAAAASKASDLPSKIAFARIAADAARAAAAVPEQRQNGWYNLAMFQAAENNPAAVEASLRAAIAAGPTWFKAHWALARLLFANGRLDEAQEQARLAVDLDGGKDPEVAETVKDILSPQRGTRSME